MDTDTQNPPTATATDRGFSQRVRTPTTQKIRNSEGEPAIRSSVVSPSSGWASEEWVVTSPREQDALDFSTETAGIDAAKEFIDDTDLSAETVLIHQYRIEECLTLQLEQLRWRMAEEGPEGTVAIGLEYTETERDVNCGRDAPKDVEATVMRVPTEVEGIGPFQYGA